MVMKIRQTIEQSETYLGDGLYASFDGYQIQLRAPTIQGDRCVYLESQVLLNFLDFVTTTTRGRIKCRVYSDSELETTSQVSPTTGGND